ALVVEPGGGVALGLSLGLVGAVVPLVVDAPRDELGGAVFAQVVGQPLGVEPALETILHHQQLVPGDGLEMARNVHGVLSPLWNIFVGLDSLLNLTAGTGRSVPRFGAAAGRRS